MSDAELADLFEHVADNCPPWCNLCVAGERLEGYSLWFALLAGQTLQQITGLTWRSYTPPGYSGRGLLRIVAGYLRGEGVPW